MLQSHNAHVGTPQSIDERRWRAIADRDSTAEGQFFYGVTSTGVYCRPTCPSRKPRRDRVRYFDTTEAAEDAGFRPCRRCHPTMSGSAPDAAVARAADYITRHVDEPVTLSTLAAVARLSPFHLQRQFKKTLGVSPRQFQAAQKAERFRRELRRGRDVAAATYEAGYGSPSRVYDAVPTGNGMPPAVYRRGGEGSEIGFVTLQSDMGWLLVAATPRGLCAVKLGDDPLALEGELRSEFARAAIEPNRFVEPQWLQAIVDRLSDASAKHLPLDVRGTAFQWRVWRALQSIPPGETRSYSDVARAIGAPSSARAVARACASNPVGLVIPCHRVVAQQGVGGYRWGVARKRRLLEAEKKAK